ncbi:hypothetical protein B0J12DRAFT_666091 [Macrophomina phaseolina]|uniref:Uncharacterized protein n=1 Tax=Macrophomina phaseolina TaxID=35725 RepID=A0ABQ8G9C1_9PEZI|nr:hypothetical protein B0J12DRAFT_666091 [Macrophomina phaseolina]
MGPAKAPTMDVAISTTSRIMLRILFNFAFLLAISSCFFFSTSSAQEKSFRDAVCILSILSAASSNPSLKYLKKLWKLLKALAVYTAIRCSCSYCSCVSSVLLA